jgi:hypothetical protein
MEESWRRALALLIVVAFFMMIIGPLASLAAWLVGLVLAFLLIPIIVILGMNWSRKRADEKGGDMLNWRGLTEEEWTEDRDPDDFEGEVD